MVSGDLKSSRVTLASALGSVIQSHFESKYQSYLRESYTKRINQVVSRLEFMAPHPQPQGPGMGEGLEVESVSSQ